MSKIPHNRNASTIKTNLVDTGIENDVTSTIASTLVSRASNINHEALTGKFHNVYENVQRSTPISVINIEGDKSHEAERTVITELLQLALDDT